MKVDMTLRFDIKLCESSIPNHVIGEFDDDRIDISVGLLEDSEIDKLALEWAEKVKLKSRKLREK